MTTTAVLPVPTTSRPGTALGRLRSTVSGALGRYVEQLGSYELYGSGYETWGYYPMALSAPAEVAPEGRQEPSPRENRR